MEFFRRWNDWRRDQKVLEQWYWQTKDMSIDWCVWKNRLPNFVHTAFRGNFILCCVDDGLMSGFIHLPGSGILKPREQIVALIRRHNIGIITSHAGCGAAELAMKQPRLSGEAIDAFAREWTMQTADQVGIKHYHFRSDKLERPLDRHIARVVYYIGTPWFNWNNLLSMPRGFSVSRRFLGRVDDAQEAAELCFKIMIGHHGFGNWISSRPGTQLILVAVGESGDGEFSTIRMMAELDEVAATIGPRVIVRGLTDPRKAMGLPTT